MKRSTPPRDIIVRHRPGFEQWRGQRYEDGGRIVEVVALRGKRVGIMCKLKAKPKDMVRFSVSKEGAAILAHQLRLVLRGETKRWKTPIEYVWQVVEEPAPAQEEK